LRAPGLQLHRGAPKYLAHLSPEPPAIRVTVQGITVETTMYE